MHEYKNPLRVRAAQILAVTALVLGYCGCQTQTPELPAPMPPGTSAAVICGLTGVDPRSSFYGGWDGACPGCDKDAAVVAAATRGLGYSSTVVLLNEDATCFRFISQCAVAAASLKAAADAGARPLLFIYVSGHGGQVPDTDADEADGKDETLCLYDMQLLDDVMWAGLCKIDAVSPRIRVVFMTDTCNSGTNYRAPSLVRAVAARRSRAPQGFRNEFLHIGGCADGKSSYGDADGGVMTTAAFTGTGFSGRTWAEWFQAFAATMPKNQVPVFEYLPGACCSESETPLPDMEAMK